MVSAPAYQFVPGGLDLALAAVAVDCGGETIEASNANAFQKQSTRARRDELMKAKRHGS